MIPYAIVEAGHRLKNGVLTGTTDYSPHTVYQTKWLKFGLESLHMDTSHLVIPDADDDYAPIFWMDGTIVPPEQDSSNKEYPYLWWARKHTMRQKVDPAMFEADYPYSSESYASEADYEKQRPLFPEYADAHRAAPHT